MNRQTTLLNPQTAPAQQQWVHIDASGQTLGRLAARIAMILQGKHKPTYTPHADAGDFVVVTHAEKIVVTGTKLDDKFHERYTGYPSGRKITTWREVFNGPFPQRVLETAVKRMMPRNKLSEAQFKKLKCYAGSEHPHQAQQPKTLEINAA
jgi:large subunit ribosomal protein L13